LNAVTIEDSWARVETWLATNAPPVAASLGPPATSDVRRRAEGLGLPAEFIASLSIHDGQATVIGLIEGLELLPFEACLMWRDAMRKGDAEVRAYAPGSTPNLFRETGFPLLNDGCGTFLCLDSASSELVWWLKDYGYSRTAFPSWGTFLSLLADAMEADQCSFDGSVSLADNAPESLRARFAMPDPW
jgi:cell wall assembly regulator SMI1